MEEHASDSILEHERLEVAPAPDEFPIFDEQLKTEHECPRCHYQWTESQPHVQADYPVN